VKDPIRLQLTMHQSPVGLCATQRRRAGSRCGCCRVCACKVPRNQSPAPQPGSTSLQHSFSKRLLDASTTYAIL
jgi:hypothetical protein